MSASIAQRLIGMAVSVSIAQFDVGAIGSAAAPSSAMRLTAPDQLINRDDAPVSETDGRADHRHGGRN